MPQLVKKITLSEKIIRALPRLKCPHRLEPHQIQGLDFIHIYPVMQWLVKKVLETREEMSDYIRNFSEIQFSKDHLAPEDIAYNEKKNDSVEFLSGIKDRYRPQRQYKGQISNRRHWSSTFPSSRVEKTLLEYGHRFLSSSQDSAKGKEGEDKKEAEEEKRRIDAMVEQMKKLDVDSTKGASSSIIGNMMGMESDAIKQFASEYGGLQSSLGDQQKMGGAQSHKREVAALEKQIAQLEKKAEEVKQAHEKLLNEFNEYQAAVTKTIKYNNKVIRETAKLDELETPENAPILKTLRSLLSITDTLAEQEAQFKANCKRQLEEFKTKIKALESNGDDDEAETQRIAEIQEQYDADEKKLQKVKKLLSKKVREIAATERLIDEIPSRTELAQYQKRFLELYTQIASKLTETRQFYNLYNVLSSSKEIITREITLMNSIYDNFEKAKASKNTQDQFITSLEGMQRQVNEILNKVNAKHDQAKKIRDENNEKYLHLIEQQRLYFKTVLDFQEECRRNEELLEQLEAKNRQA